MILRSRIVPSLALAVVLLTGCRREEIRVYTAAKDAPEQAAGDDHEGHDHAQPAANRAAQARPKLSWTLPEGWQEVPAGQVNAAQFSAKAADGEALVSLTPLPNLAGKEAMVVNMWRQQVGQPPLEQDAIAGTLSPVDVAGGQGQIFEITGSRDGGPSRIVTAMLHRDDASWFFKLSGPEKAVEEVKPKFVEFLKSVKIGEPSK